jgi:hypothetical protein
MPLLFSDAWHRGAWRQRTRRNLARLFDRQPESPGPVESRDAYPAASGNGNGKAHKVKTGA